MAEPLLRFDTGSFEKPTRTDNGYLVAQARITRTGVFTYINPDGTPRRELRLPEEVFHKDSLRSFELVPLTNEHPDTPLDPVNTNRFKAGTVAGVAREDEAFVAARIQVEDAEAIETVEDGKHQLSCGYRCDFDPTPGVTKDIPGVPNGLQFDGVQRNIRGNHVALVTKGRAGEKAALRMDGAPIAINEPSKETNTMKINGVDIEVSPQAEQALGVVVTDLTARADAAEAKNASLEADRDSWKEKAEAATQRADSAEAPERLNEAVKVRVGLVTRANSVLGADYKTDALSDSEIKLAVVTKLAPKADAEKLKVPAYLDARFDSVIEDFEADENPDEGSTTRVDHDADKNKSPITVAREKMIARNQDAWKPAQDQA